MRLPPLPIALLPALHNMTTTINTTIDTSIMNMTQLAKTQTIPAQYFVIKLPFAQKRTHTHSDSLLQQRWHTTVLSAYHGWLEKGETSTVGDAGIIIVQKGDGRYKDKHSNT